MPHCLTNSCNCFLPCTARSACTVLSAVLMPLRPCSPGAPLVTYASVRNLSLMGAYFQSNFRFPFIFKWLDKGGSGDFLSCFQVLSIWGRKKVYLCVGFIFQDFSFRCRVKLEFMGILFKPLVLNFDQYFLLTSTVIYIWVNLKMVQTWHFS